MYAFCISNFFVAKFAVISCYLLEKLSIGHTFGKEIDETSLLKWVNQILSINLQAGQYSNLIFFSIFIKHLIHYESYQNEHYQ